jgi:prophage regulatory protein
MNTEQVALATPTFNRLLSRREVEQRTSLSRSTMYQQIADGIFPKQIELGARRVGWLESEINQWIATRIAAARPARGGVTM